MVHIALSDKTYLSLELLSPLSRSTSKNPIREYVNTAGSDEPAYPSRADQDGSIYSKTCL